MNALDFTKAQRAALPALYSTQYVELEDHVALAKLFTPCSNWTWYVIEFDGDDFFCGLVDGLENEFSYFSLKELNSLTSLFGLSIERNSYFESRPVGDLLEKVC